MVKLSLLLLISSALTLQAGSTYSQQVKINLELKDATLSEVISAIKQQTEFEFAYDSKLESLLLKNASINVRNEEIDNVLATLLEGTDVNFKVIDKIILLSKEDMKITANTENRLALQQQKLVGTVTDFSTNEPITGANVVIEGTSIGVITDINGKFSLDIPKSGSVVMFSFIGYETERIVFDGQSVLDIKLKPNVTNLEEIVVVGYGTQSKKDISGSIAVVSQKNFNIGATQSALDLIQGKVAGLTIVNTSSDVTSQATVYMRGISSLSGAVSPFYVIDGVPGIGINSVAPEDIESISVLKDASACAIYGSRAASGVILITTKKGKEGHPVIEYSGKLMSGYAADKPPLLSASEYRAYAQKAGIDISASDPGANTDWFDEITKQGRISQEHNISVSGGTEKNTYRGSFNYLNNEGLVNGNYLERYNLHFSYNQKAIKDKLNVTLTGGASKDDGRGIRSYGSIYTILPIYPVKNEDGTWWETYDISGGNPVHSQAENESLNQGYSLFLNGRADYEIINGLYAGINLLTGRNGYENASYDAMTTIEGNSDHGNASKYNSIGNNYVFETTLKYMKKINSHNFELLGGYSNEGYDNTYTGITVRGFITDVFGYDNLSAADLTRVRQGDFYSGGDMSKLVGYFGRLNYNFRDKYILSATIRHDGSSKFGENNKWGTFPSVSVAWRLTEESFMKGITGINDLKLRLGYGVTGNQDGIDPYKSLALYESGPLYYNNGKWENTYQYAQNANPYLKWEQTSTLNAGLDFSVINNRLFGSVDYYVRKTSDLLYTYPVPVPPYLYPNILANVGDISNKGIEFMINADVVRKSDFLWRLSLNIAHNKQLVVKLSNDQFKIQDTYVGNVEGRGQSGTPTSILREGEEISTFYGLKCLGLDADGMYIMEDVNADGFIDSQDNQVIGHAMPKAVYGISNTLSYKGFEFSFFFRGVYGNDIFNNDKLQMGNPTNFPNQVYKEATTTPLRDKALYSSYYIEKGSFLRLQNASLSYNFGTKNSNVIKKCRVYLTGENLFVVTNYSGMDPELAANNGYGGILAQGIDVGRLAPLIRRFILGVNIVF